jgi:hypothetical protein
MMVIFLSGLVFIILIRILRKDLLRYNKNDDNDQSQNSDSEFVDESGWKQIYGDVFRPPKNLELFCCLIGKIILFYENLNLKKGILKKKFKKGILKKKFKKNVKKKIKIKRYRMAINIINIFYNN